MKKHILRLLSTVLLATLLAGCGRALPPDDSGSLDDTTAPETEPSPRTMTIAESGTVYVSVIRPKNCSDALILAIEKLISTISGFAGTSPKIVTDWGNGREEATGATGAEIIIGASSYPEALKVRQGLRLGEYSVTLGGESKLVITGFDDEDTVKAIDYFIQSVLTPQISQSGAERLIFSEEQEFMQTKSFKIDSIRLGGVDFSDAGIVIPKNYTASEYRTAILLREYLLTQTGYRFPISYDGEQTGEHSIFIGKTSSTTLTPAKGEYIFGTDGKSIYIVAGSYPAYEDALAAFKRDVVPAASGSVDIAVPQSGTISQKDISSTLSGGTENILSRKGELRVMALNIWGSSGGEDGKSPIAGRNLQNAEVILTYLPDVVGLQECSPAARSGSGSIIKLLSAEYTEVPVTFTNKNNNNYTPLLYRAQRLELLESGYHLYGGLNDADSKSVTWGAFKDRDTGKVFIAASTHLWWQSGEESDAAREAQANELDELLSQLRQKYGCDAIVFGDFNSTVSTKGCGTLLEKGYVSAQASAESADKTRTHHSYPTYDAELGIWTGFSLPTGGAERSIDHLFVLGTARIHTFDVVIDELALLSSDHCPIYADITLP